MVELLPVWINVMLILWLLYKVDSLFKCFGTHTFKKVRHFILDPKGPDVEAIMGGTFRGRWEEFGRCCRCRLREDGKGFDY